MNPTMYILAEHLSKYDIITDIKDGTCQYGSLRIGDYDNERPYNILYVKKIYENVIDGSYRVLLRHMNDTIIVNNISDSNALLNFVLELSERFSNAEYKFHELIYTRASLSEFLSFASDFIGFPVLLSDTCFRFIASSDIDFSRISDMTIREHILCKRIPGNLLNIMCDIRNSERTNTQPLIFDGAGRFNSCIIDRVSYQNKYSANLFILKYENPFNTSHLQMCKFITNMFEKYLEVNQLQDKLFPETKVFMDLLNNFSKTDDEVRQFERLIGWKNRDLKFLIKLKHRNSPCESTDLLYSLIENVVQGCYTVLHEDSIVVIANIENIPKEAIIDKLTELITDEDYICGISYSFKTMQNIKKYYMQASIAIEYGIKKGNKISHCENYLIPYVCNMLHSNISIDILHPSIHMLIEYDKQHNTELCHTLDIYLINERNLVLTSAELCIHRNSLVYRINKIVQITQLNLDDPSIRSMLRFCYLMLNNNMY